MPAGMFAKIECTPAMGKPAHDGFVGCDDLLTVNAEVLPFFAGSPGDHKPPGDERSCIAWPAVLDWKTHQVDFFALKPMGLAGCLAHELWRHAPDLLEHGNLVPGVLQTTGCLRLFEQGQHTTDVAQGGWIIRTHAQGHAPCGAKEVHQGRVLTHDAGKRGFFNQ